MEELAKEVNRLFHEVWEEGPQLEFKSARGGLPGEMWPTYSAFANTQGGIILLGVEDDGRVSGVDNIRQKIDDIYNKLNNPQQCSVNLCTDESIQKVELCGKNVLAIRVPKAGPTQCPVFIRGNERNSFLRYGSGDVLCKQEDITRMRRNRDVAESAVFSLDAYIVPFAELSDLDNATIRRFRMRMQVTEMGSAWQELNDLALLKKLGAYRRDRQTGQEGVTMAGLLMFGSSDALAELLPHFQLDYFEYEETNDPNARWSDRITSDGTWSGNLFDFFFMVMPKLRQGLKQPFRLNDDLSRQDDTPGHIAVREALANALIHADYFEEFGIRINRTPHGLSFINPGSLLVEKKQLFCDQAPISVCRNKSIQRMFQALGMADKAGSGVDKIVKGWIDCCIAWPEVEELHSPDRVKWELPYIGVIPQSKIQVVQQKVGSRAFAGLDGYDKLILLCIPAEGDVAHRDLSAPISLHPADLSKRLARLVENGFLVAQGRGRGKKYALGNGPALPDGWLLPVEKSSTSEQKAATSVEKPSTSGEKSSTSLSALASLEGKSSTSDEKNALPESVLNVRRKNWVPRKEMHLAILELCRMRWMSVFELSQCLDRKMSTIRPHCDLLEAAGKLVLRHPDNPNHPQQAYRCPEEDNTPAL